MNHYTATSFIAQSFQGIPTSLTESGRELHTIVPKDAFRDVDRVEGAHPFEAWKCWFPLGDSPSNGPRTIQDVPGTDKPLE